MRQYPLFTLFDQATASLIYASQRLAIHMAKKHGLWVQHYTHLDCIWLDE